MHEDSLGQNTLLVASWIVLLKILRDAKKSNDQNHIRIIALSVNFFYYMLILPKILIVQIITIKGKISGNDFNQFFNWVRNKYSEIQVILKTDVILGSNKMFNWLAWFLAWLILSLTLY